MSHVYAASQNVYASAMGHNPYRARGAHNFLVLGGRLRCAYCKLWSEHAGEDCPGPLKAPPERPTARGLFERIIDLAEQGAEAIDHERQAPKKP